MSSSASRTRLHINGSLLKNALTGCRFSAPPLHKVAVIRIYFYIYLNRLSSAWFPTELNPTLSDDRVLLSTLLCLHFGFCSPVLLFLYFYCFLSVREANQRLCSSELIGRLNFVTWIVCLSKLIVWNITSLVYSTDLYYELQECRIQYWFISGN